MGLLLKLQRSASWERLVFEAPLRVSYPTNRLYLKMLYTLRIKENTLVKEHLDSFNMIIMDLENVKIKVESEDYALIWLCLLPRSYGTFMDMLLYEKDSISLDDICNLLKSKELKKSFFNV